MTKKHAVVLLSVSHLTKSHPVTQGMSRAAVPVELGEPGLRRNPGEPDAAQAEAGKYNKPRVQWQGLTIAIENPAGSVRRGRNRHGVTWEVRMRFDYGEILGTLGVDGDPVDVILGPNMDAPVVYVVHQRRVNDWENYDEDKCCIGFDSQSDAEQAFLSNYNDPRFLGPITAMPVDEFVAKVRATRDKPAMIKALPLVLFLKSHVGPYLRGGKIVNVAGYQGRSARPTAGAGQHDLFDADEHGEMPPARRAQREPQHTEPTRDLIAEHERLVQVLQSPSHVDDKVEAKRQSVELEDMKREVGEQHNDSKMSNNDDMQKDLSPLAQEFTAAYAEDPRGVFLKVRDELRAIASDWSSFSVPAVTFLKEMDADQQEAFVVERVVPALRAAGWPKPHTKPMADAVWSVADAAWSTKAADQPKPEKKPEAKHFVHADLQALGVTPAVVGLFRKYLAASDVLGDDPYASTPSQKSAKTKAYRAMYSAVEKLGGNPSVIISAMHRIGDFHGPGALMREASAPTPHPTDTPEFKRWFGDSVVTDDWEGGGKPRVLYHGTPADFSEFKPGGHDEGRWRSGPAIWLTPHADRQPAAHNIGGHRGNFADGTNVMPLYAKIENPLYLDEFNVQEMRGRWAADSPGEFPQWMSPATIEKMRAGGFDGIIQFYTDRSGTDNHEVIVFDPRQVKSAIGNSGAFDPDHPDITKAQAPVVVFVRSNHPS